MFPNINFIYLKLILKFYLSYLTNLPFVINSIHDNFRFMIKEYPFNRDAFSLRMDTLFMIIFVL